MNQERALLNEKLESRLDWNNVETIYCSYKLSCDQLLDNEPHPQLIRQKPKDRVSTKN